MASGAAIRQDWPPASADCRGINFYSRLRGNAVDDLNDAVSGCPFFVQGPAFAIATVGYVTVQEGFGQTKAIKLMAIITSIVLVAPVIGPLSAPR